MNCGSNHLFSFLQINFTATIRDAEPSNVVIIALKLLLKWATKICGPLKWATARKRLRNTLLDSANTPIKVHWFGEK